MTASTKPQGVRTGKPSGYNDAKSSTWKTCGLPGQPVVHNASGHPEPVSVGRLVRERGQDAGVLFLKDGQDALWTARMLTGYLGGDFRKAGFHRPDGTALKRFAIARMGQGTPEGESFAAELFRWTREILTAKRAIKARPKA